MEAAAEIKMLELLHMSAAEQADIWEKAYRTEEFQHSLTRGDVRHIMDRAVGRYNVLGGITEYCLSADDWHELKDVVGYE